MQHPLHSANFYYPVKVDQINQRIEQSKGITTETLAWLERFGLIARGYSVPKPFEAISSGPFAALGWPGASRDFHRLISDMVCALFVVDDMCDDDHSRVLSRDGNNIAEVFQDLRTIWELGSRATAVETRPLRASVRDVRVRLEQAGASEEWLLRSASLLNDWFAAMETEMVYKQDEEVPTVEELMTFRPDSGAAMLFMELIPLVYRLEMPSAVYHDARMATLRWLAGKIIIYTNDILSHKKESEHDHSMNTIASLVHHERMNIDDAVAKVLDTHNSAMAEFETLANDLAGSALATDAVRTYVRGLQHYMHGLFVWGLGAGRYSRIYFDWADHSPRSLRPPPPSGSRTA